MRALLMIVILEDYNEYNNISFSNSDIYKNDFLKKNMMYGLKSNSQKYVYMVVVFVISIV